MNRLCLDGTADLEATLTRGEMSILDNGTLLDNLLSLSKDELDVARVGHVGVDLSLKSAKGISQRYGGKHTRPWAR